ncbi:MAG: hypothetical protein ACUVUQ_02925 [Thermodesulfovibrionales bacterium]
MYKISDYYSIYQRWFPDDSKIAFNNPSYNESGQVLCYIDTDGNNFNVIEMDVTFYSIGTFCFINNGDFIVFSGNEVPQSPTLLYKISYFGGHPTKLFEYEGNGGCYSPSWSNDGWIYFLRSNGYTQPKIWRIKSDGTELSKVDINFEKYIESINCSKDGEYLVFDYLNSKGNTEMKVVRLSDKKMWSVADKSEFTNSPIGMYPTFSPDGKWICFNHMHNDEGGLYIVPFDNSDDPVKVADCSGPCSGGEYPDWSSDGKWIVFCYFGHLYELKVPAEFLPK